MVDHTFVYTGAVRTIRGLIDAGDLGELLYLDSVRVNLGLFQQDSNVIWDLAAHDLSIMDYLIDARPVAVSADGTALAGFDHENVAYVTVHFDNGFLAHFHVNWLAPVKIRQMLLGGRQRMLVYDDMDPSEKVRVYDKGVDLDVKDVTRGGDSGLYRTGDMHAPKLDRAKRCARRQEFADRSRASRAADRRAPASASSLLEAAERSLRAQGRGSRMKFQSLRRTSSSARTCDLRLRQSLRLRDRRRDRIGRSSRFSAARRSAAGEDLQPHLHLRRRRDRDHVFVGHGVTFINDRYPRAVTARASRRAPRLEGRPTSSGAARRSDRAHDSLRRRDRRRRDRRRGQRRHANVPAGRSWPAIPRACSRIERTHELRTHPDHRRRRLIGSHIADAARTHRRSPRSSCSTISRADAARTCCRRSASGRVRIDRRGRPRIRRDVASRDGRREPRLPSGGHPHHAVRRRAAAREGRARRRHVQRARGGGPRRRAARSSPRRPRRCTAWPRAFPTAETHHPYANRTIYGAAKVFNEGAAAQLQRHVRARLRRAALLQRLRPAHGHATARTPKC